MALSEILEWSNKSGLPWVQDALRRLITHSEISDFDVTELAELCMKRHGLSTTAIEAVPIAIDHLPSNDLTRAITLSSLTHVADVNALVPNESITFCETGLTVVYGQNGTGKSSYARILKKACRARGNNGSILPNALSDLPAGTPTAKIKTAGAASAEHTWKDGEPGPADLAAVSVFDSAAAQVYVEAKTEVRFRPLGLDLLDKLGMLSDRVRSVLDTKHAALRGQKPTWPLISRDTEAGSLLASLTALTSEIETTRIGTLSESDKQELSTLAGVLASAKLEEPAKKASNLRLKAARLKRLKVDLQKLGELLDKKSIDQLISAREEASKAEAVAKEASISVTTESVLAGLDSPHWQSMWSAASVFSRNHAYKGKHFPHIDADARCVLCQQNLESEAKVRLSMFEAFVQGAAQKDFEAKKAVLDNLGRSALGNAPTQQTKDALDDLALEDDFVAQQARVFLVEVERCRSEIQAGNARPSPILTAVPADGIEAVVIKIELMIVELEKAADPAERKRSEARHAELNARAQLSQVLPQVLAEITRLRCINAHEQCNKDTDTRSATKLSTDLTKKYVTDTLTKSFSEELVRLGFTALELELRPAGGQKGVLYHQVLLKRATNAVLANVVSEGESRCIALAAFLAEVRSASHPSAIVFDDPVSSLDHNWRTNVAKRLVEEAKQRQVIVFTHEMVFLAAIIQNAESHGVDYFAHTLWRGGDLQTGVVDHGLPWAGLPTKKRIGALNDRWQEINKIARTKGQKEYEPLATRMYADLRRTWERAVEEVLLENVVQRFRESIETQRLKKISDVCENDLTAISNGMTKCSKWEGGHDHSLASASPMPGAAELKQDIEALEKWVASVQKRRN